MSLYKTTLKGTESFCHLQGYSLFDDIELPIPLSTQSAKELLIRRILYSSADYEVLYSDPVYLKSCIEDFFAMNKDNWQKVIDAMLEEYDPLWNYDRYEEHWGDETGTRDLTGTKTESGTRQIDEETESEITGTGSGTGTRNTTGTNDVSTTGTNDTTQAGTKTVSGTNSGTESGTNSETDTNSVSAYNNPTGYVAHDKVEKSGTDSKTTSGQNASSETDRITTDNDTTEIVDQDTSETERTTSTNSTTESSEGTRGVSETNAVSGRSTEAEESTGRDHYKNIMHGNIGVTTSQQMLEAEYLVRLKYNIYDIITKMFMREFLILVDF